MRPVFLSSGASTQRSVAAVIGLCREAGLTHVELASGLPCSAEDLSYLRAQGEQAGFQYLVHNYFPAPADPFVLNLAAQEPDTLARSVSHCQQAIDLCVDLQAPFYSVHAGFAMPVAPGDLGNPAAWRRRLESARADVDSALDVFVDSVRKLADYAAQRGVRLLLENNVVSPLLTEGGATEHGLLLVSPEDIAPLFESVNHAGVGMLCDVAHARVSATALGFDVAEFMAAAAPWIQAFHISDNDGRADTNEPVPANPWFASWLQACPDAALVLEVYRLSPAEARDQHALLSRLASPDGSIP
jgi:sugar phosphate isomerase/epimerase